MANKRGSLLDIAWIGIVLLLLAVTTLLAFKITDSINTGLQNSGTLDKMAGSSEAKGLMSDMNSLYPNVIDNSFLFLAIGLAIVAVIFAMMVVVHPIFFIFYFILLIIIIFITGVFSNIYIMMEESTALASVAAQLTFTSFIMGYLPYIVGVVGFLISIVMYKTWQNRAM